MSVCGIRLNMTSCAGVNATICISSVRESTSKRSAFDFTHCNRLCRWRHLLMLSEVILKAHAAHRHSRNLSFLYIIYHKYHFLPSGVYLCTILGYNVFVYFINRRNYLYNEKAIFKRITYKDNQRCICHCFGILSFCSGYPGCSIQQSLQRDRHNQHRGCMAGRT